MTPFQILPRNPRFAAGSDRIRLWFENCQSSNPLSNFIVEKKVKKYFAVFILISAGIFYIDNIFSPGQQIFAFYFWLLLLQFSDYAPTACTIATA